MRIDAPLGVQTTVAFVAFGTLLTLVLGAGVVYAVRVVERDILDDTLAAELAYVADQPVSAEVVYTAPNIAIHAAPLSDLDRVPAHLRTLPPGRHDLVNAAVSYRVLVSDRHGLRYFLQYDDTRIREREQRLLLAVALAGAGTLLLALFAGGMLARRVSRPVRELAQGVVQLRENPDSSLDVSACRDDEVGLLAREIRRYNAEIREALAREKEFAGNVSHELRTPVTNISLAAEVMAARCSDPKDRERIDRIVRGAREISELIDTFLVLSRQGSSTDPVDGPCDVAAVVREVVSQQSVWLGDKPVEVRVVVQDDLEVCAPPTVVSVLVANLVRNAFRYTAEGLIRIVVDHESLLVEDTGPGIPEGLLTTIFQPHVRAEVAGGDGAGLGLAIVQRICERYGWRVGCSSSPGAPTRFRVDFRGLTC